MTTHAFDVAGFLEARQATIVDSAGEALAHRALAHYRAAGTDVAQVASRPPNTLRLEHLFEGFEGDVHPG